MSTHTHEGLTSLFRSRPALAAELLPRVFGVGLPVHTDVRAGPTELPDMVPTEYRADAVVVLAQAGEPVLAVVVEVQLRRDRDKRWSWPVYVATLRARLHCPVELLVVCARAGVAAWCAVPVRLGLSGSHVTPLVLGPDLVPVLTDADEAERVPELAVLSAVAHGGGRDRDTVLPVLLRALAGVETEQRHLYLELVCTALPQAARRHLEDLMSTYAEREIGPYGEYLIRRGEARGEAHGQAVGEARAVLAFLEARGISVSDDRRASIAECTDLAQLDVWVRRAATATTVEDLFD